MRYAAIILAAMLSVIGCLFVAFLWVRSYWRCDTIERNRPPAPSYALSINRGRLVGIKVIIPDLGEGWQLEGKRGFDYHSDPPFPTVQLTRIDRHWQFAGISYQSGAQLIFDCRVLGIHLYIPLLLTMLLSGVALLRLRRIRQQRWRLQHNRCICCGYDLRASPERCPECGRVAARPAPAV